MAALLQGPGSKHLVQACPCLPLRCSVRERMQAAERGAVTTTTQTSRLL